MIDRTSILQDGMVCLEVQLKKKKLFVDIQALPPYILPVESVMEKFHEQEILTRLRLQGQLHT